MVPIMLRLSSTKLCSCLLCNVYGSYNETFKHKVVQMSVRMVPMSTKSFKHFAVQLSIVYGSYNVDSFKH
jgi:hypothetical protein